MEVVLDLWSRVLVSAVVETLGWWNRGSSSVASSSFSRRDDHKIPLGEIITFRKQCD